MTRYESQSAKASQYAIGDRVAYTRYGKTGTYVGTVRGVYNQPDYGIMVTVSSNGPCPNRAVSIDQVLGKVRQG